MKKMGILVILILASLLLLRALSNDEKPSPLPQEESTVSDTGVSEKKPLPSATRTPPPQKSAREIPAPKTTAPILRPLEPLPSVAAQTPTEKGRPRLPPPGAVPFHREGRLLVAYGDIVLGEPASPNPPAQGFAKAPQLQLWESREIPYFISPQLENPERVLRALSYFNDNTLIRFVPFKGQPDALVFEPTNDHCRSYLGRIGGHQPVYLSSGCGEMEITHELMHALGFVHEQSRPDRDQYVKIHWSRIEDDKKDQFEVVPMELIEPIQGRPFDYRSVMIYSPTAFALRETDPTMESITSEAIEPTRSGLSSEDLARIQLVYGARP